MQSVVGTAVDLAGDGRCDSPGHSAKYCTYVLYAGQIGRIFHCEHVTVHQVSSTPTVAMTQARTACYNWRIPMQSPAVPNSAAMEKEGLSNSLEALERQGINIRSLTTGRVQYNSPLNFLNMSQTFASAHAYISFCRTA